MLKKGGASTIISLSSLGIIGSVSAEESTVHGVNTSFDPNSDREIRQFFKQLGDVENKQKRIEVHERLGEPQAEAITDVITGIEFETNVAVNNSEQSDVTVQSSDTTSISAEVSAEHYALGYTVWSFEYEVEWDYDQNEVSNIQEMERPNVYDPTWSADGESGSNWMNEGYDDWNGRSQHKFSYIGGGTVPTLENTPWIELEGFADGTGNVVDSNNGV